MVFARKSMDPPVQDVNRLLTVAEVAEKLNVSPSLVYQMVETGKLPFLRIGNGRGAIRFQGEDIQAYLDSCRVEKTTGGRPALRLTLKHLHLKQ
jgi:excisionase family DNA binding protein